MIEIKIIPFSETYSIRNLVLRPGKPLSSCYFEQDQALSTIHLGLYYKKEISAITSIYVNKNANFTTEFQFQIRGMAVLEKHQNKGFGSALMHKVEGYTKSKKAELIWFNARESAILFYKKLGYSIVGEPFIIGKIGIHYLMYKPLND
jgi:ribosomal protein S18 acetylase RimI-like enzyme